jgi:DNA end-binding protein Ku
MSRIVWNGAISFSLIHIPVSLHSATRSNTLDLDLLDRRDFSPVGYQKINRNTGKPVEWEEIVKGFEYEKEKYVALSDEDFRLANVEATRTIEIMGFVDPTEVAPTYFETPYYLAAGKRGEKVYTLFREVLTQSSLMAIGMVVIRTRQYVCALFPMGSTLVLNTLRYADEILAPEAHAPVIPAGKAGQLSKQDLGMALKLVKDMRQPWDPTSYRDTYRDDLMKRIEQKIEAGETRALTPGSRPSDQPAGAQVLDLTSLLKRSLESRGQGAATTRAHRATASRRRNSRTSNARRPTAR